MLRRPSPIWVMVSTPRTGAQGLAVGFGVKPPETPGLKTKARAAGFGFHSGAVGEKSVGGGLARADGRARMARGAAAGAAAGACRGAAARGALSCLSLRASFWGLRSLPPTFLGLAWLGTIFPVPGSNSSGAAGAGWSLTGLAAMGSRSYFTEGGPKFKVSFCRVQMLTYDLLVP